LDFRPIILVASVPDQLQYLLCRYIEFANYQAVAVADIRAFDWQMVPDLVVCEHRAPQMDGVKMCRNVRLHSNVPILVVISSNDPVPQPSFLDAGADMCLSSPYDCDHFLACLRSLLRRSNRKHQGLALVEVGDFRIVQEAQRCLIRGKEVRLTSQEFRLMSYLVSHPYRVLRHEQILQALWGEHYANKPEFLRPVVMSLRKKVEKDWRAPAYIRTEHKGGYFFVPTSVDPDVAKSLKVTRLACTET
jgi:two-component system KDP operon response regulator KdpE